MSIGSGKPTDVQLPEFSRCVESFVAKWSAAFLVPLVCGCAHLAPAETIPDALGKVSPEELFEEGVWHASRGDSLRAEQYFGAARDRGYPPQRVVAWLMVVCVAANRYRAALDHASIHLRRHPSNWWLRLVVASIHDALGDFEAARVELEQVVSADPARALPHYRLGLLYQERFGDLARAARHLERYRQLDPHGAHSSEVEILLRNTAAPSFEASQGSPSRANTQ